jgi:predicted N-formylglutamate amidohydrolase
MIAQRLLWLADHASNRIPPDLANLGLEQHILNQHIAYDIGTGVLAKVLRDRLGGRTVQATVSRLVVDYNREPDHPGLIAESSDGIVIPGNVDLPEAERQRRLDAYFHPYHDSVAAECDSIALKSRGAIMVSIHSFTPKLNSVGMDRPWHIGILYNRDDRLAKKALAWLNKQPGLVVGDNEPYSGKLLNYTMDRHAEARGLPYVSIEIRQDLLADAAGIARWVRLLADMVPAILKS